MIDDLIDKKEYWIKDILVIEINRDSKISFKITSVSFMERGIVKVILDLSNITFNDTFNYGYIWLGNDFCIERGGNFAVVINNTELIEHFKREGFFDYFKSYPTLNEAVKLFYPNFEGTNRA